MKMQSENTGIPGAAAAVQPAPVDLWSDNHRRFTQAFEEFLDKGTSIPLENTQPWTRDALTTMAFLPLGEISDKHYEVHADMTGQLLWMRLLCEPAVHQILREYTASKESNLTPKEAVECIFELLQATAGPIAGEADWVPEG
jgi:hypothetical protein